MSELMVSPGSLWTRCRGFVANYRRSMQAARLFGQGRRLYCANQVQEAIGPLQTAVALIGTSRDGILAGVQFSTRICAVTLLAQAAADAKDQQLALASIRDGMAMWAEAKLSMPQLRANETLCAWEKWAQAYVAWIEAEGKD